MINGMGAFEYRAETHPVHERNEMLEKEIDRLKSIIDGLRLEIRYLEEQVRVK